MLILYVILQSSAVFSINYGCISFTTLEKEIETYTKCRLVLLASLCEQFLYSTLALTEKSMLEKRWEKVLYKKQPFPDNFVSTDFLSELRKNVCVRKYYFDRLLIDAGGIYQQLCCISTFLAVYYYLLLDWISPGNMCCLLAVLTFISYLIFLSVRWVVGQCWEKVVCELRTGLVIVVFNFLLAPILHSLLATVSTDSIYAMTITLLLGNWVLLDYHCYYYLHLKCVKTQHSMGKLPWFAGSNTTAFSCSLLAALCLASRLSTPLHTFALLSVSTCLFALWPSLIGAIRMVFGRRGQLVLTILSCLVTNAVVWPIAYRECPPVYQYLIAFAVVFATVSLNFIGPWLLMRMQAHKGNIHGPWDEAVAES